MLSLRYIFSSQRFTHQFSSALLLESSVPFIVLFNQQSRYLSKMSFEEKKGKFLTMPLEEKRKLYLCKEKFKTISDIPTWVDYLSSDRDRLNAKLKNEGQNFGVVKEEVKPDLAQRVSVWKGDITTLEIDAIVNAANSSLLGGGGVDGAIHRAAGKSLLDECRTLGGCLTGGAKITGGYLLPAKYVIHTVGPQGEYPDALKSCYNTCLEILLDKNLKTIAFPCISTGIYGYPQEAAAKVALTTVRSFMEKNPTAVDRIIFCVFMPTDVSLYENLMQLYFPID